MNYIEEKLHCYDVKASRHLRKAHQLINIDQNGEAIKELVNAVFTLVESNEFRDKLMIQDRKEFHVRLSGLTDCVAFHTIPKFDKPIGIKK